MTSEPGSFARKTIVERKPQILARVIADNAYPLETVEQLYAFRDEIASQPVQPLHEETVGQARIWHRHWRQHQERTWLELPWYFAETYFYRRLLEAVGYFQLGPWYAHDPFNVQKRMHEAEAIGQVADAWAQFQSLAPQAHLYPLVHAALWGNRSDLSNYTIRERAVGDTSLETANILIDDTDDVCQLIESGVDRVAFINDNVGADTLFDLILSDHLLTQEYAGHVTFHLKNQPFFVSDAMPDDIQCMVAQLCTDAPIELAGLGTRLQKAIDAGALELSTDPFWTLCLHFDEMPAALHAKLTHANLIILKGDVNYRRLLSDRHWPPDTRLDAIAPDFPKPYLILRTLKGELIAGLKSGEAEKLQAQDPTWLINGKRGLIHLVRQTAASTHNKQID